MNQPTEGLASWPRNHFKPDGGRPFLFYVVFGQFPEAFAPSQSRHRIAGIPTGIDVMHYRRDSQPDVFGGFAEGYLWGRLQAEKPALAEAVQAAPECLILRGEPADDQTLDYLRDVVGFITYLLEAGGVAVYDPLMFQWWAPDPWRARIFEPAGAVPRHHVVILVSEEDDGRLWLHTRGMLKFGRPDLSIHNVAVKERDVVVELLNRFIEMMAFGEVVAEGQPIRLTSLPDGFTCHHAGDPDDPDFNNVHLEIRRTA